MSFFGRNRTATAMIAAVALLAGLLTVAETPSPAAAAVQITVGATSLAKPASGRRYIYVATNGTDTHIEFQQWLNGGLGANRVFDRWRCLASDAWKTSSQKTCPEPTRENPLRTIKAAIRAAQPGDVIVVRAGTYTELPGYGAVAGTPNLRITMQAMPGERVTVSGGLLLKGADYWNVYGMRFVYNSTVNANQSVVGMSGGTGWELRNNEIRGTTGVANLLVNSESVSATAALSAKQDAAPNDFLIQGNVIHQQNGVGPHGQFHNIYLLTTLYSSGGKIRYNLLGDAPNGAQIKAAAANAATGDQSPRNVIIEYNTMLRSASGVTIGLQATGIVVQRNIIAYGVNSTEYDGGIKTYQLANPGTNAVRDNLISGYIKVIEEDWGATPIFNKRNATTAVTFTGTVARFDASPTNSTIRTTYGREVPGD